MIPFITEVQIRNYKSIAQSVTKLEPFTAFVGSNSAGKSNFIDALAFLKECLSESIDLAFKNRGGIVAVRRRSGGHPTNIGIRLRLVLKDRSTGDYAFEIAAKPNQKERFVVARERCVVRRVRGGVSTFEVQKGEFLKEIPGIRPKVIPDRLALYAASGTEEFRPIYDHLTAMQFYSIVPTRLRELQEPDPGAFLKPDGSNAAAVLKRLGEEENLDRYNRVCRLLSKVADGVQKVEYRAVGQRETLQFKQDVGLSQPWRFDALNMSDGTLRVLGLLLGVYQANPTSLVAIEEPEATVHPAVAELIVQVLLDASKERQILITTHSPDILNYEGLNDNQIRVIRMEHGQSIVAPVSQGGRKAIRDRLYTAGELLRTNELNPDVEAAKQSARQLDLFSESDFKENKNG